MRLKLLFFLLLLPGAGRGSGDESWPRVSHASARQTYLLDATTSDTPFSLDIRDSFGSTAYRLECHSGEYENQAVMNFSGTFHCAFFALKDGARTSWNLLATDEEAEQRSDWYNRGRMLGDQLWGPCADYPEFGAIRNFRLRGMRITFRFDNLKWFPFDQFRRHRLRSFRFTASVVPDAKSSAPQAERVGAMRPPISCAW